LDKRIKVVSVFLLWILLLCAAAFAAESGRLAYVPNEGDNNLMVVDLNAERVIKTLPTGKTPHALAFTRQGKCYVNNRGSKDITVIDANRFEVIRTIPLPATSFQLALSPDGKTLAVAYKDVLKVSLVDTGNDAVVRTVAIGREPEGVFKGAMMKHPYWSRDGRFVYASDNVNDTIIKIDAATGDIKATIALPGTNHYVHPSRDGQLLYALNETTRGGGTSITLIDSQTDKVVKDIPIPLEAGEQGRGHHGAFSKDGRYFFFCNEGGSTVAVMDTAKKEIVKTIRVGAGPGHPCMTADGKYIFVIHHRDNVLTVIDVAGQEVIKNIPVGTGKKQAHAGYFTPDGNYFYMINAQDSIMNKIDVSRMEVVSKIAVGRSAMNFGIKEGEEFPDRE
jgi:YVTN family beta-propeller protein